jgi:hypothetical protein
VAGILAEDVHDLAATAAVEDFTQPDDVVLMEPGCDATGAVIRLAAMAGDALGDRRQ